MGKIRVLLGFIYLAVLKIVDDFLTGHSLSAGRVRREGYFHCDEKSYVLPGSAAKQDIEYASMNFHRRGNAIAFRGVPVSCTLVNSAKYQRNTNQSH